MTPGPNIAIERGRSFQSNTSSLMSSRSPSPRRKGAIDADEPVAITAVPNATAVWSSICNVPSSTKRAWPRIRFASGIAATLSSTKPTKRSRSRFTRAITAGPSIRTAPSSRSPNSRQRAGACAASAAAISSLLGMQPTRAQVVPYGPPSISTARLPAAVATR